MCRKIFTKKYLYLSNKVFYFVQYLKIKIMDIVDLILVEVEVERFLIKLHAAKQRSKDNKGFEMTDSNTGCIYMADVGNISGTKESGAVKRAALDLKRELTKITK